MAERHHSRPIEEGPVVSDVEKNPRVAEMLAVTETLVRKQEHTVPHEGVVTIHAGNFHGKDGKYRWHMKDPKGQDVPLRNSDTAEPSFVAELLGDYVARFAAEEGSVQFTFHVVD